MQFPMTSTDLWRSWSYKRFRCLYLKTTAYNVRSIGGAVEKYLGQIVILGLRVMGSLRALAPAPSYRPPPRSPKSITTVGRHYVSSCFYCGIRPEELL